MERVIAFPTSDDGAADGRDLALRWSGRISLTARILAVNIIALLLLAGGFFYLDSYRSRIVDNRVVQATREARLIAEALGSVEGDRASLTTRLARDTGGRVRVFDANGKVMLDSQALGVRNFVLRDPDADGWSQRVARFLDRVIDTVVGAPRASWTARSTPSSAPPGRRSTATGPIPRHGPRCGRRAITARSLPRYGARPIARRSSPPQPGWRTAMSC